MSTSIIEKLGELRPESGVKVLGNLRALKIYLGNKGMKPLLLINPAYRNGKLVYVLEDSADRLLKPENRIAKRKVMTLDNAVEDNYTFMLNNALMGGRDYPLLTSVAGVGAGLVSFGAGLIFSGAATSISLGKKAHRILARGGDELWQMEEIGKATSRGKPAAVHVLSYFLLDPFRGANNRKVWLIHEQRTEIEI